MRKTSWEVLPYLTDDFYDIIYIDGNHNNINILEDCVLSFRKLKVGGFMILDDYNWSENGDENTSEAMNPFMYNYRKRLQPLAIVNDQVILRKTR